MDIPDLAASAVALLSPYVIMGSEAFAKKVGGATADGVGRLISLVKAKLTGVAAAETMSDLEAMPEDERRQGALAVQLEKSLEADPGFVEQLQALVEDIQAKGGAPVTQIMNVTGDNNTSTQISGSGNSVTI